MRIPLIPLVAIAAVSLLLISLNLGSGARTVHADKFDWSKLGHTGNPYLLAADQPTEEEPDADGLRPLKCSSCSPSNGSRFRPQQWRVNR